MDKYQVLKSTFGHTEFRPGQEQLIDGLLAGRDVLGVMPTGAGKSMCYQVPALMLDGVALVISQTGSVRTFSRSTAEVTFGCGMKQDGGTSNSSSGTA